MSNLQVVGRSFPQVDSPEKVQGNAAYVGDISLPRMVHAKVLRSPHAHARILKIHTDKALRVRGVVAVLTGEDAPRTRWGVIQNDQKVLAQDKVRYIGEEMAVVVADSEEVALEGLSQLEVDYKPLPAVFDPEEALKRDDSNSLDFGRTVAHRVKRLTFVIGATPWLAKIDSSR